MLMNSVDHGEILTAGLSDACDTKDEAYFNIPMTIQHTVWGERVRDWFFIHQVSSVAAIFSRVCYFPIKTMIMMSALYQTNTLHWFC